MRNFNSWPNPVPKYLGPKELEVVARLSSEKTDVISYDEMKQLFGKDKPVKNLVYQLKTKGILRTIKKGLYWYSPYEEGGKGKGEDEIPSILFPKDNYYVGYATMFNRYGFTDQISQTTYILNTTIQKERIISGVLYKLLRVSPARMYGLTKYYGKDNKKAIIIESDKERTLVDLFHVPEFVGGLGPAIEVFKRLVSENEINIDKFIDYADRFPFKETRKRIGYALELVQVQETKLQALAESVKDTAYIPLNGNERAGVHNKKWRLIIDDLK